MQVINKRSGIIKCNLFWPMGGIFFLALIFGLKSMINKKESYNANTGVPSMSNTSISLPSSKSSPREINTRKDRVNVRAKSLRNDTDFTTKDTQDEEETFEKNEDATLAQYQAQAKLLENSLFSESPDADWSDLAETDLFNAVNHETVEEFELIAAECRNTLCRLDLEFNNGRFEDGMMHLKGVLPWNGEAFLQVEDVNSGYATLYIAREEFSLPRITISSQ